LFLNPYISSLNSYISSKPCLTEITKESIDSKIFPIVGFLFILLFDSFLIHHYCITGFSGSKHNRKNTYIIIPSRECHALFNLFRLVISKNTLMGCFLKLPSEMRKRFVGFRHLMSVFSFLYCFTFIFSCEQELFCKLFCHWTTFL